uniref:Uncharacterized protein n=1 Tax=Corvus moneduloides TaxID=1196302 RepID=A0A8C3D6F1_CORMO
LHFVFISSLDFSYDQYNRRGLSRLWFLNHFKINSVANLEMGKPFHNFNPCHDLHNSNKIHTHMHIYTHMYTCIILLYLLVSNIYLIIDVYSTIGTFFLFFIEVVCQYCEKAGGDSDQELERYVVAMQC